MFGRESDGGAAEGVVEPGVFGVGCGEEAFEVESGADTRDEGAGPVKESEEAVPIDGEEEGMAGCEEGSARGERNGAVAEGRDGDALDGIRLGEFGDEDEFFGAGGGEGVKKVRLQKRLEAAFGGHPDGRGLQEGLESKAGGRVGEVIGQRADGGEERLINARAGVEPGVGCNFGPRDLCRSCANLRVGRVLMRGAPGEGVGNAEEGMQNDQDRLEYAAIGLDQRDAVRRVGKLFGMHERDDSRQGTGT